MSRKAIKSGQEAVGYQEKRRLETLQRQKAARKARTDTLRLAAAAAHVQDADAALEEEMLDAHGSATSRLYHAAGSSQAGPRLIDGLHPRDFYARQFMHPEWMTDVPRDLAANWSVRPRPEGRRCIVVSYRGRTVSRQRTGAILHQFSSLLPDGSEETHSSDQFCMLDCVFSEVSCTYWVLDLLCWRGCDLHECTAEFRMFWLGSKLQEDGVLAAVQEGHQYRFGLVPVYPSSPEGLQAAYHTPTPYPKDGLLILHQQGHYAHGAVSPLALLWKDPHCSPYWIDTDAKGVVPEHQQVTLLWREGDGALLTSDDPPVTVGSLHPTQLQQANPKVRPGRLLRLSIQQGGLQLEGGVPVHADLHFEGVANQRKGRADSWSKVLFQYMARHSPLTLQDLLLAAEMSSEPIEEDAEAEAAATEEAMVAG